MTATANVDCGSHTLAPITYCGSVNTFRLSDGACILFSCVPMSIEYTEPTVGIPITNGWGAPATLTVVSSSERATSTGDRGIAEQFRTVPITALSATVHITFVGLNSETQPNSSEDVWTIR